MAGLKGMAVSILLAWAVATPVNSQTVSLATTPFEEEFLPTGKISGDLLMGVLEHGTPGEQVRVAAYIPSAWAGALLCVRVSSIDGFYTARNEYLVGPDWRGGFEELEYPSAYGDRLLEISPQGIGVRVTRGTCSAPPREFTVARWNAGAAPTAQLLVNPLQTDAVFAYLGSELTPVRCADIPLPGKSAFHVACDLSEVAESGPVPVELLRVEGSQSFAAEPVLVWLPRP